MSVETPDIELTKENDVIQIMKSDEVRNSFRDVLDAIQNGTTVVIERYNKSIGVLIPIEHWQSYQIIQSAIAQAKEARARRERGEARLTSSEEMVRLMNEKRSAHVDA
jgi:antitoxin (DNA-binding transcriptional repressor) of toxin-antitoxin stability system